MKLTFRNERLDREGVHNDRNFDVSKASHIDSERSHLNRYWVYNGMYGVPFKEVERTFYKEKFQEYVDNSNERYIRNRNYKNVRDIDTYREQRNSRPEDKILQIGNMIKSLDGETLWKIALEYKEKFMKAYGDNCQIVDMALHMDEEVPHIHIRRVWFARNDYGETRVSERGALAELGFERNDMSKSENKKNNPKITQTQLDRQILINICKEHNLELDLEPDKENDKHERIDLIRERTVERGLDQILELKNEVDELEDSITHIDTYLDNLTRMLEVQLFQHQVYRDELEKSKKLKRSERALAIRKIYKETFGAAIKTLKDNKVDINLYNVTEIIKTKAENKELYNFIKAQGLEKKFLEHQQEKTKERNRNNSKEEQQQERQRKRKN